MEWDGYVEKYRCNGNYFGCTRCYKEVVVRVGKYRLRWTVDKFPFSWRYLLLFSGIQREVRVTLMVVHRRRLV